MLHQHPGIFLVCKQAVSEKFDFHVTPYYLVENFAHQWVNSAVI